MEPGIFFLIRQIGSFIIALAFSIMICAGINITPFDSIWSYINTSTNHYTECQSYNK